MVVSRSASPEEKNDDSVKRDRSESGERKSRSKSRNRSRSPRRRRSSSPRRSRSRGRRHSRSRSGGSRSRSSSHDGYRLHIGGEREEGGQTEGEEADGVYFPDLDEECRKADLERVFMKYGPLKEIWLASYAPFYAFIVFRHRTDAQVMQSKQRIGFVKTCLHSGRRLWSRWRDDCRSTDQSEPRKAPDGRTQGPVHPGQVHQGQR